MGDDPDDRAEDRLPTDWATDEHLDDAAFHEALGDLLAAAEAGGASEDAVAGLLTAYLARLRGDVRLPLGMPPERARALLDRAEDHAGETMEVEVLLTEEVFEEMELQLRAVEGRLDEGERADHDGPPDPDDAA